MTINSEMSFVDKSITHLRVLRGRRMKAKGSVTPLASVQTRNAHQLQVLQLPTARDQRANTQLGPGLDAGWVGSS